jgi:hypothetical protein
MQALIQSIRDLLLEATGNAWLTANRIAGYAILNLLDDPAILAMAFC